MSTLPPASQRPSPSLRLKSAMVMGVTGVLSKFFLYGFNRVEVTGLSRFLELLESRKDPAKRQRGLLTVSNHISVLDDPVVWGILPLSYAFDPSNLRWTLGAADICFANKAFSTFFTQGQVLPCHRLKHSPFGGLFQPALTQAIRLLSTPPPPTVPIPPTYTTTGSDAHPSPLLFPAQRRYSWVHVFPEGCVHQHASTDLRYFKWGLARLILESEPAPDVLPMFIDGTQRVMPEDRGFPRFVPRVGKTVRVAFGEVLDYEATFGDLKRRWDGLVAREREREGENGGLVVAPWRQTDVGELTTDELKHGKEAQEIRIEVARRMRDEILKLRRSLGGYPEPDPAFGLAETWRLDDDIEAKKYKSRVDGSNINQD
ncbi:acyltransferase-like protein [Parathielavia appendiculata]|uniref:Tafazzin family protein n=1 Tax=Parathielavia appendiculata TaxID=2587402 RepID=A0AAN6Z396_9PEZI|nr:acyltransferase-like protein [Parathielavia appendiculata]